MLDWLLYSVLMVVSVVAVALNVLGLPGNWAMFLGAVGLSIWHNGHHPAWWMVAIMGIVLTMAEVMEFLGGMVGARTFGASRAAGWAAIAGTIIGGLIGIPPLTVPMLGLDHLVGAVAGAFLAAWAVELLRGRSMTHALKGATGAALGRGAGIAAKILAGILVWVLLAVFAFPWFPW